MVTRACKQWWGVNIISPALGEGIKRGPALLVARWGEFTQDTKMLLLELLLFAERKVCKQIQLQC